MSLCVERAWLGEVEVSLFASTALFGDVQVSLFVAGALFGEVQMSYFVTGAVVGEVQMSLFRSTGWKICNNSRSAKCPWRARKVTSVARVVDWRAHGLIHGRNNFGSSRIGRRSRVTRSLMKIISRGKHKIWRALLFHTLQMTFHMRHGSIMRVTILAIHCWFATSYQK